MIMGGVNGHLTSSFLDVTGATNPESTITNSVNDKEYDYIRLWAFLRH